MNNFCKNINKKLARYILQYLFFLRICLSYMLWSVHGPYTNIHSIYKAGRVQWFSGDGKFRSVMYSYNKSILVLDITETLKSKTKQVSSKT